MQEIIAWVNCAEARAMHPLDTGGTLMHFLLRVLPYPKGNARIARLLCGLLLMRMKYPPIIFHSDEKIEYARCCRAMLRADDAGPFGVLMWREEERIIDIYLDTLDGNNGL